MKILLSIAFIVAVFLVKEYHFWAFLLLAGFVILSVLVARVSVFRVIKSIRGVLFFVVFSAVLQIFFNRNGTVLWEWQFIHITDDGLLTAAYVACRIVLIVMGTSVLTLTTTPVAIADGIESLLTPLKWVKFPVHEFALIMSIALRFIPTLMDETDRIIRAQKARGADFESGNLFRRAKALVPILIPLLISAFRRADELGDAMDARCYAGSKNRTKYKKLRLTWRDFVAAVLMGGLIAGAVLL